MNGNWAKTGSSNSGTASSKMNKGGTIRTPYGKTNSDVNGSSAAERGKSMGGGVTNLSHSLSGTSAKQRNP